MFQLHGITEQDMNTVRNQRGNNDQILSNFASLFRLDSSSRIIPTLQSPKLVRSQIFHEILYILYILFSYISCYWFVCFHTC